MKGRVTYRSNDQCRGCGHMNLISRDGKNITITCLACYRGECARDEGEHHDHPELLGEKEG